MGWSLEKIELGPMILLTPFQLGIFYNSVVTGSWIVVSADTEQSRAILLLQLVQFPKAELMPRVRGAMCSSTPSCMYRVYSFAWRNCFEIGQKGLFP